MQTLQRYGHVFQTFKLNDLSNIILSPKMDKIAANNHFVVLRKEIKKAKAMVSGNLIRKIAKLKQEKEKNEKEDEIKKFEDKIECILRNIKLLKTLDSYLIAKQATLLPDIKSWNTMLSDSKATDEDRLIARVVIKNNVQKMVSNFRKDHKDCDEWLNEYIEYREKKKDFKDASWPVKRNSTNHKNGDRSKKNHDKRNPTNHNNDNQINRNQSRAVNGNRLQKGKKTSNMKDGMKSYRKHEPSNTVDSEREESLHPSWESKRREKEILRAAFSSGSKKNKRIVFDAQ